MERRNRAILGTLASVLLLLIVGAAPCAAQCNNCWTPGNEVITPTPTPQFAARSVGVGNSYLFDAELCGGVTYLFSLCGGATWDTYLTIYAPGCGPLLVANDDACGSLQSEFSFTPAGNGTYSLEVSSFLCGQGGAFTLTYQAIAGNPTCLPATQASVDAIEAKADTQEVKLDSIEAKLDAEASFTDDAELAAASGAIITEVNANEVKIDLLEAKNDSIEAKADAVEVELGQAAGDQLAQDRFLWETQLCGLHCVPSMWLPAANGGSLEDIRDWVDTQINAAEASGDRTADIARARMLWNVGNNQMNIGLYMRACQSYGRALQTISLTCP